MPKGTPPRPLNGNPLFFLGAPVSGSMNWETVAHEFAFDGSWRDIYVFDTDIEAWQRVLDELRRSRCDLVFRRAGEVSELPVAAVDAFPAEGQADQMLSITFAGVLANCHFFAREEIEFDIDPRDVQGQVQLEGVFAFMRLLSDATGKDAVLTPENCREIVVFRSLPGRSEIEYYEFGG